MNNANTTKQTGTILENLTLINRSNSLDASSTTQIVQEISHSDNSSLNVDSITSLNSFSLKKGEKSANSDKQSRPITHIPADSSLNPSLPTLDMNPIQRHTERFKKRLTNDEANALFKNEDEIKAAKEKEKSRKIQIIKKLVLAISLSLIVAGAVLAALTIIPLVSIALLAVGVSLLLGRVGYEIYCNHQEKSKAHQKRTEDIISSDQLASLCQISPSQNALPPTRSLFSPPAQAADSIIISSTDHNHLQPH